MLKIDYFGSKFLPKSQRVGDPIDLLVLSGWELRPPDPRSG